MRDRGQQERKKRQEVKVRQPRRDNASSIKSDARKRSRNSSSIERKKNSLREKKTRERYPYSSNLRKRPRGDNLNAERLNPKRLNPKRGNASPKKRPSSLPKNRWWKIISKIGNVVFYVLTIGFVLGALLFAANRNSEDGSVYGYSWYNVKTNSMVPTNKSKKGGFYAGDMIVVKKTDFSDIKVGDVVTFRLDGSGNNQLTHRVVEKLTELNGTSGEFLITQGDANDSKDAPVSKDRIIGTVQFVIPKVGVVISQAKQHWKLLLASIFGIWLISKGIQMYRKQIQN